jgi:hypothetical protein
VSAITRESELSSTATSPSEESSLDVPTLIGPSGDSALTTAEEEAKYVDGGRTSLPSVMVGDDSSLFKILKDNMGKVCATNELVGKT